MYQKCISYGALCDIFVKNNASPDWRMPRRSARTKTWKSICFVSCLHHVIRSRFYERRSHRNIRSIVFWIVYFFSLGLQLVIVTAGFHLRLFSPLSSSSPRLARFGERRRTMRAIDANKFGFLKLVNHDSFAILIFCFSCVRSKDFRQLTWLP